MRIGSLVEAKWHKGLLGVVVSYYRTDYGEYIWHIKWVKGIVGNLEQSSEFKEDLIVLCE